MKPGVKGVPNHPLLFCAFLVKVVAVVLVHLVIPPFHGVARVLVEKPRNAVDIVEPPLHLLPERDEMLLDDLVDGPDVEFRVLQEPQKELQGAVARSPAHAVDGGVQHVHSLDDALLGVGVSQLDVVVAVETQFLNGDILLVEVQVIGDLLGVKGPVGVHQVQAVHLRRLGNVLQSLVELRLDGRRHRHDVKGGVVTLVLGALDRVQGLVDLGHVAGRADHVHGAVLFFVEPVKVDAADVEHDRKLGMIGPLVAPHHPLQELLVAKIPRAELGARVFVALHELLAQLDDVHPRAGDGGVNRLHEILGELVIVDQPPVADGAIQDLELFSKHGMSFLRIGISTANQGRFFRQTP